MDYNELLERYFEGTATLEEERILRRWADAPDYARAMFGVFEEAAAHRSSCELDLVAAHPNKHKYQLKNQLYL